MLLVIRIKKWIQWHKKFEHFHGNISFILYNEIDISWKYYAPFCLRSVYYCFRLLEMKKVLQFIDIALNYEAFD